MSKLIAGLSIAAVITTSLAISAYGYSFQLIADYNRLLPDSIPVVKVIPMPLASDVQAGINQLRSSRGLVALSDNPVLDQAAQVRADSMCAANDWSHTLDGDVLRQYYTFSAAGENLYYDSLEVDQAADAVLDWGLSPSHLSNMVDNYTEFGIAVKSCPGFQGNPTAVIITNYFGVPR